MEVIFMVLRPHRAKIILFLKKPLQGGLTRLEHRIYSISTVGKKICFFFFLKNKISGEKQGSFLCKSSFKLIALVRAHFQTDSFCPIDTKSLLPRYLAGEGREKGTVLLPVKNK